MSDALKGNPKRTVAPTAPPRSSRRGYHKASGKPGHACPAGPGSIPREAGKPDGTVAFFPSTLSKKKHEEVWSWFFFLVFLHFEISLLEGGTTCF